MGWRFAQISDVHLGARLSGIEPWLANTLRLASREALAACLRQAAEQGCQAVLIPGDLFDLRGVDPEGCLAFAYEHAERYEQLRVLIAPGNSDAFSLASPYAAVKAPPNVTVFTSSDWGMVEVGGVPVTGRGMQVGEGPQDFDPDTLLHPVAGKSAVLLLHVTLSGANDGRPLVGKGEGNRGRLPLTEITAPQLAHTGYSYVALGHLHSHLEVLQGGLAVAAYAGTPQCLDWDEMGPGGFLLGELVPGGARLRFQESAMHRWLRRSFELPVPYAESYPSRLAGVFQEIGRCGADGALLQVAVAGQLHEDARDRLQQALNQAREGALYCLEPDLGQVRFFSGLNPQSLPEDSLLSQYFSRCAAEAAQSKLDPAIYELARRVGWLLFTGQGLPAEIGP